MVAAKLIPWDLKPSVSGVNVYALLGPQRPFKDQSLFEEGSNLLFRSRQNAVMNFLGITH